MSPLPLGSLLRWALWAAAGGLALFGAQLFVRQRSLVFRPSARMLPVSVALGRQLEPVVLQTRVGTLRGWWLPGRDRRRSGAGARTVYLLPGAIGNISHEAESMAFLSSMGVRVFALDYPGYGESTGRPSEDSLVAAADAGWAFLTTALAARPDEMLLFGRSLGGVLALRLAARHRVRGLVLHSAFTSLPEVAAAHYPFLPARLFCLVRFDARAAARELRCPVLFVHGRDDRWIPPVLGRRCYDAVEAPKQLIVVPGGHGGATWTRQLAVRRAIEDLWSGEGLRWA